MKKYLLSLLGLILVLGLFGFVMAKRLSMNVEAANYNLQQSEATPSPVTETAPLGFDGTGSDVISVPTPEEPETESEPQPESFTISYIGDLTLVSHQHTNDYDRRMNGDFSYPFSNVVQFFADDEYTIGNLECTFSDRNLYSYQTFYFRAPTDHANILIEGGVDFVTTANNHTMDFFEAGVEDTSAALEEYGIPYGLNDQAQIVTTPNGLKLGIYCQFDSKYGDYRPDLDKALAGIEQLKADGAEYIICAFHWGIELHYHQEQSQIDIAHACIDAGADMIYGSHPHCLQPIEEYNGGLILYSMGNFSFGGNTAPKDRDTAIVQVNMVREPDGSLRHDGYSIIPCCLSSRPVYEGYTGDGYNDYKPTPYEEGTEDYERCLSKITGTYEGPNGQADYSNWHSSYGG